jgi:serine-type D-Ala-D-Ala carboxypeptidase/endopeptidase (penicillin-binding protein 4)
MQFKSILTFLKIIGVVLKIWDSLISRAYIMIGLMFFLFLSIGSCNELIAQEDHRFVQRFIYEKSLTGASVGIVFADAETGENILVHNPDILLAPASVTKLVTTAAAFELLGPEYRFQTFLAISGTLNKTTGHLAGNLVIRGGGDPVTGSLWFSSNKQRPEFPAEWVTAVQSAGIKSVAGDIVLDISSFRPWDIPDKWMWEDLGNYYGAVPEAINLFDNTVRLHLDSPGATGELTRLVATLPEVKGITWINEVRSSAVQRDLAYVYGNPADDLRLLRGTVPAGRSRFEVKASMPDPPMVFGVMLKEQLQNNGISVSGNIRKESVPVESEIIYTVSSPQIARICSVLNHESVNLIAESIVTQLALKKNGYGSHSGGLKILNSYLSEATGESALFMDDGSGLSRFTALSAAQITNLLRRMHQHPSGSAFKATLPSAGVATLRPFSTGLFPGNTLRGKSGSMTRVRAYAGYLTCRSGREIAFSILVNNFSGTQAEVFGSIERLLSAVSEEY